MATGSTDKERVDRELSELLQGLRVMVTGVQVLFAFLFAMPFQAGFAKLDTSGHWLATLFGAAVALAAEDGRDRVEGEQHVADGDGHDDHRHRGQHAPSGFPDRPGVPAVVGGGRQYPCLLSDRYGEAGHDDAEDEQVVDRQAVLRQVPGEELHRHLHPGGQPQASTEGDGQREVDAHPHTGTQRAGAPSRPAIRSTTITATTTAPVTSHANHKTSNDIRGTRLCATALHAVVVQPG
ncbi:DUF6328 family protein [Nonomuraea sp. NPDC050556]|uniref:DUF6328 family protein n=1 Tax=Nonomuraea sp. NPDC050556 TaxID=3364369 RepID=UPI00378A59C5